MKEIIKKWCETGQLTIDDATTIITEYLSLDGRQISGEQLTAILQIGQGFVPINWFYIIGTICNKNNWYLVEVQSAPDEKGNRRVLYRYIYEQIRKLRTKVTS